MDDATRKKLFMRCNHRGMKEMDIILGKFASDVLPDLEPEQLGPLEALLEENDQELLAWVLGREETPERHLPLITRLREYHGI